MAAIIKRNNSKDKTNMKKRIYIQYFSGFPPLQTDRQAKTDRDRHMYRGRHKQINRARRRRARA